jgi:surface protein
MSGMFFSANPFNQPLNNWDVSNVITMDEMFASDPSGLAFNQDISGWDVSSVTNMNYMFQFATSFNLDLSGWCVTNIPTTPTNFSAGATAWSLPKPIWGTCPTTTTTTTAGAGFSGTVKLSTFSGPDACFNPGAAIIVATGNASTFCTSTTFNSSSFTAYSNGTYYLSFGGSNLSISITGAPTSTVTVTSGCVSC